MAPPVSRLKLVLTLLYVFVWPAGLFALAGSLRWVEGWVFAVWFVGLSEGVIVWLYRKNPSLLAERYRRPGTGGQRGWDQLWTYAMVLGFVAWFVMMPLDRRWGWTPPWPLWAHLAGGGLLIPSMFLLVRAFADNSFLSPLVRVQDERQQTVVTTGVYGFVRHPMYLGAVCMFFGVALLLGSLIGVAVAVPLTMLIAIRIVGEERLLMSQLDGYREYRQKVRARLVPFVW